MLDVKDVVRTSYDVNFAQGLLDDLKSKDSTLYGYVDDALEYDAVGLARLLNDLKNKYPGGNFDEQLIDSFKNANFTDEDLEYFFDAGGRRDQYAADAEADSFDSEW